MSLSLTTMPRKILSYWHCSNYKLWWSDFLVHHPFQHVRQSFLSLATLAFSKSWHSRCIYHLHFTTDQPNSPPISLDNFSPCLWCANVPLTSSWRCNFLSLPNLSNYNLLKVFHFSRGILPSWDVWYDSWEVVLPREASGGFDFSRGKNQTKPTSHEEAQNHTIVTSHEGQNQTIPLLTSIKTIPSLHLTSIKNHTITTSHE